MGGIVDAIGTLITGSGGSDDKVKKVVKEQKKDDTKAKEDRRSRLRAAITDQPSLFATLSSKQGKTDL